MNNYLFENIRPLAKMRKSNERFFDAFTDGYSNIYSAIVHLVEAESGSPYKSNGICTIKPSRPK